MKVRLGSMWVASTTFALGLAVAGVATAWQLHVNRAEAAAQLADLASRVAPRVAAQMQLYELHQRDPMVVALAGVALAIVLATLFSLFAQTSGRSRRLRVEQGRRAAIHDRHGRCFGRSKTVRDISEARRAQKALADLNANLEQQVADRTARLDATLRNLRNIVDALPSMIGYWSKDLTNGVANRAYSQWFGIAPEAMNGRHMREVLGDHAFERTRPYVEAVLRGEPQIYERAVVGSDGSGVRHLVVHYLPDSVDGDVRGFYVLVQDLTELTESRLKLLETSTLLKAVLAAASEVAIIASNTEGVITLFNRGAERLLGYDQAELVGHSTRIPLHLVEEVTARGAELSEKYAEPIAGFRVFVHEPEHHGPETREWTYVCKDGRHVPVSLTVTAMRDDRGQLFGYLGVAHDVSRQQEQQRSLRDAVHKAKHANNAKTQFLANMSHEIRTPMNAVIGLSHLLEHTKLDAEQAGFLAKITLASKSLLLIINDVLDLSKIEANELTIERAPFDLGTLLGELSALMMVQADAKRVDFAIDAPGGLPLALEGDSIRLHQILTNLLSNAIKFTERGSVGLHVRQVPAAADRVRLRFVVKDSGIGIAPEALARLFAPFAQADASTTRRFGGTGLGLSIVKQLVGLMGGELGVSSTPDVGSEFWVELPFGICDPAHVIPAAVARRSARRGLPGVRVLVADDSTINLEVARRILEMEGAVVRLAGNGQEAIDELLAHPDSCDVVLMDIHMPVLDGYDATRRIRTGLGLTRLPIIALTAGTLTSEQQQAESAGVSDFISKPFDPQALVSCIRRHVPVDDRGVVDAAIETPAVAPDRWPAIDGIDTADVRTRLRDDVGLFTAMLRRLLADFSDLGREQVLDAAGLDHLAARMHTLKGSAGTLGARSIQRIAAEAEVTCRAHQADQTARLLPALAEQLHRLQRSAAPTLDAAAAHVLADDEALHPTLDRAQLTTLLQLLRHLDLAALPRFAALSPQLRRMLGHGAYAILHKQIDDLQFGDAARTLEALPS